MYSSNTKPGGLLSVYRSLKRKTTVYGLRNNNVKNETS